MTDAENATEFTNIMSPVRAAGGSSMMTATPQRLPNRRGCENFSFQCSGLAYVATISRFQNGDLAEIFVSNHKTGSDADTAARDSAVVCSIGCGFHQCARRAARPRERRRVMSERRRPTYLIRLRPKPKIDAIRALRGALKVLNRRFGLRAIKVEKRKS
jgi:hypothetical protein